MQHQRLFRPLGGSCADSEESGGTTLVRIYKDHNPFHPIGNPCGICLGAGELIVVE